MPRIHNIHCECNECHGADLRDQYPDLLGEFTAAEVAAVWIEHSETLAAGWISTKYRSDVVQVFEAYRRRKTMEGEIQNNG